MEFLGLFISISIGVGLIAYFEGRRIGRMQGVKKGTIIGYNVGLFIGKNEALPQVEKMEMMRELNVEVH